MRGGPSHGLRKQLQKFKREHIDGADEIGSYPEKAREALDEELRRDPVLWSVMTYGRQAIIEFFMSGVWRTDSPTTDDDADADAPREEEQPSFHFTFDGKKLPSDITYRDPNAGKHKMRTVSIKAARIWQWEKANELKDDKIKESQQALAAGRELGAAMLLAAGGDRNAYILDVVDPLADAAC